MNKNITIVILSVMISIYILKAQGIYTATVRDEYYFYHTHGEWRTELSADLWLDGELQPPSNDYFYEWYRQNEGEPQFLPWDSFSGYGVNFLCCPDGMPGHPYPVKVFIHTVPGGEPVESDPVILDYPGIIQSIEHWQAIVQHLQRKVLE